MCAKDTIKQLILSLQDPLASQILINQMNFGVSQLHTVSFDRKELEYLLHSFEKNVLSAFHENPIYQALLTHRKLITAPQQNFIAGQRPPNFFGECPSEEKRSQQERNARFDTMTQRTCQSDKLLADSQAIPNKVLIEVRAFSQRLKSILQLQNGTSLKEQNNFQGLTIGQKRSRIESEDQSESTLDELRHDFGQIHSPIPEESDSFIEELREYQSKLTINQRQQNFAIQEHSTELCQRLKRVRVSQDISSLSSGMCSLSLARADSLISFPLRSTLISDETGHYLMSLLGRQLKLVHTYSDIAQTPSDLQARKSLIKSLKSRSLILTLGANGQPFALSVDVRGDVIWTCEKFATYFQKAGDCVQLYTLDAVVQCIKYVKMWIQERNRIVVKADFRTDVYDHQLERWVLDFALPMEIYEFS